jgi:DNA invertase Pin-like site-specific DNA recombinase
MPHCRLMLILLGGLVEFEGGLRRERTRTDKGPKRQTRSKPILTRHQQPEARKRLEAGETQRRVAASYNVSQGTISLL